MVVHVTDEQRRARLVERQLLGPTSVDDLVNGLLALHSSDPIAPFLGAWARLDGFTVAELETALYDTRSLWRLHAMRRTLFVVRHVDAALFHGAVGSEVAAKERQRLARWMAMEVTERTARRRLAAAEQAVLAALSDDESHSTGELTAALPQLKGDVAVGGGKWAGRTPLSGKVLNLLAMELKIVRGKPAGTWRSSQYEWMATGAWFAGEPTAPPPEDAQRGLLERYLRSFGPATSVDMQWWTGWGVRRMAAILEAIDAQPVQLESGEAWVAAGDDEFPNAAPPSVTLLPGLDPTPMGWKERGWFLGNHESPLFDRNGNIGPSIWIDGRIVGTWGQTKDGRIATRLLESTGRSAERAVARLANELTDWLDGTTVTPRFPTPLQRELAGG